MGVPASPQRIVSLAPNLTEILFALGLGHRIVGTSEFTNFPPEAAKIPAVGSLQGDIEKILFLRPDLVVATTAGNDEKLVRHLESLGLAVYVTKSADLPQTIEMIDRFGSALGVPEEARKISTHLAVQMREVEKRIAGAFQKPRVAYLVWPEPIVVAGGGTFLDDLITRAGGVNVFGKTATAYPSIGREELAAAKIEIVLYPSSASNAAAFENASAGTLARFFPKTVRWIAVDGDRSERPGPRLAEALLEIERAIHPVPAR